jgi:hypothetical protein
MTAGFPQIEFVGIDKEFNSSISVTPEVRNLLIKAKVDPDTVNRIVWPIGAGSYSSGLFLVHEKTAELLGDLDTGSNEVGEPGTIGDGRPGITMLYGYAGYLRETGLVLTPLFIKSSRPLFSQGREFPNLRKVNHDPNYYLIELCDERYWWQLHHIQMEDLLDNESVPGLFKHGINITSPRDRGSFLQQSLWSDEEDSPPSEAWTPFDVLGAMLGIGPDNLQSTKDYRHLRGPERFPYLNKDQWRFPVSNTPEFWPGSAFRPVSEALSDFRAIQDMHPVGMTVGNFIDTVLTANGYVLVAEPAWANDWHNALGYPFNPVTDGVTQRYVVIPQACDWDRQGNAGPLNPHWRYPYGDSPIIFGGTDLGVHFEGFTNDTYDIGIEIPEFVDVLFPKTIEQQAYTSGDDDPGPENEYGGKGNYTTDRWASKTVSLDVLKEDDKAGVSHSIRGVTGNDVGARRVARGRHKTVHANLHAIFSPPNEDGVSEWLNEEVCTNYSFKMAFRHWTRYGTRPWNVLCRGILWPYSLAADKSGGPEVYYEEDGPESGAQTIIWSIAHDGPTTQIISSFHHPLFGFVDDEPLTRTDISTVGGTRTYPRQQGGVLLDSGGGFGVGLDVYHAEITEVFEYENGPPKYTAVAFQDPSIQVIQQMPQRMHNYVYVDIEPANVGDTCIIGILPKDWSPPGRFNLDPQGELFQNQPGRLLSQSIVPSTGYQSTPAASTPGTPGTTGGELLSTNEPANEEVVSRGDFDPVKRLYVWEFPQTVQCSDPGQAQTFYNSPLARIHGY